MTKLATIAATVVGAALLCAGMARAADAPPLPPPSAGPGVPPAICTVPDVRGKTLARAKQLIRAGGCKTVRTVRVRSTSVKAGRVVSQSLRPGTQVAADTTIRLRVSRGR
jgi:PASTA domain